MAVTPHGTVIFCDDIRHEVGGKVSYIGVYRRNLFVHGEFPFTLPKFGIRIHYVDDIDEAPEELEFQVWFPGDAHEPSIGGRLIRSAKAEKMPLPDGSQPTRKNFYSTILLSQVQLKQGGPIRVYVIRNGERITLGTLFVNKAPGDVDASTKAPASP
jgi:hypothetical protein